MESKPHACLARILVASLALLGLCIILSFVSFFSNRNLPGEENFDTLSPLEKARLMESIHLKSSLGDQAWPGWGSAYVPVIVWNRSYEFLTNYEGKAPSGWSEVAGEELDGQPYYRRAANDPQNFAYLIGDSWTASMATKQTTDHFLIGTFRGNFPGPLKQIFPYRILLQPSETQIGAVQHESFHAYQYQNAPKRMAEAESIHKLGEEYQASASAFQPEWKKESGLLADALKAKTQAEKIELVQQFLDVRDGRRKDHDLNDELVNYERWLEWEEGTAKYIEVKMLRLAAQMPEYQPLPETKMDRDFKHYKKIDQRWSQELFQLRYQTTSGENQFYMTGLAQAFLLDDLLPGWQEQYWDERVFLEDLLRQAACGCSE